MNPILLAVILFIFALVAVYMLIKNRKIKILNRALKENDFDHILTLCHDRMMKRFLSEYVLDLYIARAYNLKKDEEALKTQLRTMMKKQYDIKDDMQYLQLYYHIFVHLGKTEFALELLERIKQVPDEKFVCYHVWTKEVLLDGRSDLCTEIEEAIDRKDYYGFPLAVCVYLMGIQKKRLSIYKDALDMLEMSLEIFLDGDAYIRDVKKEIQELHDMGYKSTPKAERKRRR